MLVMNIYVDTDSYAVNIYTVSFQMFCHTFTYLFTKSDKYVKD